LDSGRKVIQGSGESGGGRGVKKLEIAKMDEMNKIKAKDHGCLRASRNSEKVASKEHKELKEKKKAEATISPCGG